MQNNSFYFPEKNSNDVAVHIENPSASSSYKFSSPSNGGSHGSHDCSEPGHSHGGHSHGHGGHSHGHSHGGNFMMGQAAELAVFTLVTNLVYLVLFAFQETTYDVLAWVVWNVFCAGAYFSTRQRIGTPESKVVLAKYVLFAFLMTGLIYVVFGTSLRPTLDSTAPIDTSASIAKISQHSNNNEPFPEKFVHLDLKGAPPQVQYFEKIFPLFREWGATGILIEWEDTLPYQGQFEVLRSKKHFYTPDEVAKIQQLALNQGLKVVPLMQSFGHLEFLLKHPQFANLKFEGKGDSVDPSNDESAATIKKLLDQVMSFHPHSDTLHIGGDEVWHLHDHPARETLFLRHMTEIVTYVTDDLELKVMMWDDMMRQWSPGYKLFQDKHTQIVTWNYRIKLSERFTDEMWKNYEGFQDVWAASAFKGAFKSDAIFTPIRRHVENHIQWLHFAENNPRSFKGIILTGWQRYNHWSPLCELLPVGLPSLALDLAILSKDFSDTVKANTFRSLGLPMYMDLGTTDGPSQEMLEQAASSAGSFPGSDVFSGVAKFELLKQTSQNYTNEYAQFQQMLSHLRVALKNILYPVHIEEFVTQLEKSVQQ